MRNALHRRSSAVWRGVPSNNFPALNASSAMAFFSFAVAILIATSMSAREDEQTMGIVLVGQNSQLEST